MKKTLKRIQPRILNLEQEIRTIGAMENKVEAIVRLFQIISPLEDEGGFNKEIGALKKRNWRGRFNTQIQALEVLQRHITNAGRDLYGLNRTVKGEEITPEKVFLGDVFGLWTKPAAHWLAEKPRLEKTFRPDISKNPGKPVSNWYIINDYQCGGFVRSHTDGIMKQIAILKATA